MRNTLLVMRHEFYKTLRSTGYVIFAFIIPVVVVLILVGVQFYQGRSGDHGWNDSQHTVAVRNGCRGLRGSERSDPPNPR